MRLMHKYSVVFVLALALLLGSATVAFASHYHADYDGWAWEEWQDQAYDTVLGTTWYDYWGGARYNYYSGTEWYSHASRTWTWYPSGNYYVIYGDNSTIYDQAEMWARGAGPTDWGALYAHEHAHQMNWDHGEGSPMTNAAYREYILICGC